MFYAFAWLVVFDRVWYNVCYLACLLDWFGWSVVLFVGWLFGFDGWFGLVWLVVCLHAYLLGLIGRLFGWLVGTLFGLVGCF